MKNTFRFCLVSIMLILLLAAACSGAPQPSPAPPGETEAIEFNGVKLTPIRSQNNNAIKGTQHINRETYRLIIDGLVDNPLSLTYDDLLALPQESRLVPLNCVEGWSFTAKWTGPTLTSIFVMAGVLPGIETVFFRTADDSDGFTDLELSYILDNDIMIGLKLNDITLPDDRGFPFQVVAQGKYGYKWAKWVTRIEFSGENVLGYWEKRGYNDNADINGPAFAR